MTIQIRVTSISEVYRSRTRGFSRKRSTVWGINRGKRAAARRPVLNLYTRFDWYSDSQIVVWRRRCPLLGCATDWLAGQRQVLENELRKVARCGQPDLTLFGAAEYPLEDATVAPDQQLHVDLIFKERNLERRFFFSNSRVVLETTYSQNIEYVEDKAWRYLHHSDGHCHVVIICDMTWPVTQPFKAVISVWTKQQTGIIDEDYPLELMDGVDHAPLDHPLPAEEQLVAGLASFESPVPSPTLAAKSPNPTRVELGLRTKGGLGGEREKKIVQRSVHVLIDETADQETEPEDQSESRELALLVYDFLRVCPIHQDAAPLDDDLVLPLKELRSRIRRALKLLRQGPS
ncbi:hypothetical protein FRC08_000491 [Ceratobasidium sp. 394]|nr:hypothetical protein FRC08_000491 [Ceratobasidium sp. 394]